MELSTRAYLLIFVAALLIPLVAFAALVLSRFAQAERSRYQVAALSASERIAAAIDRELAGLQAGLQALATGRSFGERAYDRFYERALEVKRIIDADVILKDATGQQLVNTRVSFGTPIPASLQRHERRAIELKQAQVSDLFVGAFSGRSIVSVTIPLLRNGEAAYLLTIAVDQDRLGAVLRAQALPDRWTTAITDRNGAVIARAPASETAQPAAQDTADDPEGEATREGTIADGRPALLAFARPQLAPDWRVTVGIPLEIAAAPLHRALVPLVAGGAVALVLSLAVAAWIGERSARALGRLARAASALGASRPVQPDVTAVREINLVAAALVEAAARLQERDRERRDAEEALKRLNENLEVAVEERSAQLVQLQKLEAIGQLTGGVAHDFNNLLMAVLGSLELLQKRVAGDARAEKLVANAVQGARRGATLTQRLLAFARRQDLAPTAVDVAALVRGMSDLLRRSLGPQVELDLSFPADLPPARADANQLELAVLNLAVNGRDAMPSGGRLAITARLDAPEDPDARANGRGDPFVVLSVQDSGQGMDEDTLRRAAEPFFTTKGIGKGTGLGLSMVHGLAEQSGGRLALASREGRGTTAELWLPLADEPVAAEPARTARAPLPHARGRTILLVDDDPLVLSGTASLLEDLGHDVVEACSGREALEHLDAGVRVDLLVTDYAMPGMNGLELIERFARRFPLVPAILATGFADSPEVAETSVPRLGKPFTQAALAAALAQALEGGRDAGREPLAEARA